MHQLQRSWVRSQHPSAQWNLRGGRWSSAEYCTAKKKKKSPQKILKKKTLTNHHIHLCLFKLGCDVHALLSSVLYILSGENITAVYSTTRRRWDQNTTQVANRLDWAEATYVCLLHLTPWYIQSINSDKHLPQSPFRSIFKMTKFCFGIYIVN
jgi:hypothetical protein